jgi:predicted nucleotidyltransferase
MAILLHPDFQDFLKLLNSHKVDYLIIGGYAVGFYGYPRTTADIDIWIAINPPNAAKMVLALKEFGFDVPELSAGLFLQKGKIIRMGNAPVRIEILTTISGVSFNECYRNKTNTVVDGVQVNIINLEDLKKNKKASGREKDLDDLKNLF